MKKCISFLAAAGLFGVTFLFGSLSLAQQGSLQTGDNLSPKQVYLKYLATNDIAELKEMLTGKKLEQLSQANMTSEQISMIRMLSFQDQRVIEEKIDGDKATLAVEGTAFKGSPEEVVAKGKIFLLKINGAWKFSDESWEFPNK